MLYSPCRVFLVSGFLVFYKEDSSFSPPWDEMASVFFSSLIVQPLRMGKPCIFSVQISLTRDDLCSYDMELNMCSDRYWSVS